MKTINTYIGAHHLERVEDDRFLRGHGEYVDDLTSDDTWHAVVLRSGVAHGYVVSIDTQRALEMPGVYAVLTAKDIEGEIPTIPFRRPNPTIGPYAQPAIAANKVRYFGEPVALILAESAAIAEDAIANIVLDIESLPAVVTREAGMEGKTLLFEETTSTNVATVFTAEKGDAEAAFRKAHLVVSGEFSTQRQTAMPLETRGLLAEWSEKERRLRIWGAAKLPFFNRKALAQMMNLPETAVDYIEVDVGGGFGARGEFYPEDYLVAFAAKKYGHPIKWVEDRREHFTAIAHSRQAEAWMELAFDKDGQILGLRGNIFCDIGAYVRPNGMTPVRNAAQFTSGPYRIPNIHLLAHAYVTNKTPSGTYRGPGRYEGCFFIERLIDLAAAKLAIDRVQIRRRNVLRQSEMPYPLASVLPSDGRADTSCDSGEYSEVLDRCIAEFKWHDKANLDGKRIGTRYHGIAVGCFIEGGASGPSETARMSIETDGSVSLFVGSSAIGQGLETVMSQIAADMLEIEIDRIHVFHGSTTYLKEGWGSYGSRATVMGGSAVMDAAKNLLQRFRIVAAERLRVNPSDVDVSEGIARTKDGRSVPFSEVSHMVESEGRFDNSLPTYTYGAAAAHVAVDPETGHVEVLEYVVCDDVGRIINHLTLHGQVTGAAIQGMGSVFSEALVYDEDGTLLVGTLADYVMPLATDYPRIHCISLESYPSPNNPLGAKGAGEGGIIPVAGVIANAVTSALRDFDVEANHLPLSPFRIWEMVQQSNSERDV